MQGHFPAERREGRPRRGTCGRQQLLKTGRTRLGPVAPS
ncbi:MATK isoform 12, partial [Pan troglodytes]